MKNRALGHFGKERALGKEKCLGIAFWNLQKKKRRPVKTLGDKSKARGRLSVYTHK